MTPLPRIPAGALEAVRSALAAHSDLGVMIAQASRPFAHLTDDLGAEPTAPRWLTGEEGFHHALRTALPRIAPGATAGIWRALAACEAPPEAKEVVLTRALDPLGGLLTYPDETMFSAAEVAAIARCEAVACPPAAQRPVAVTGIVKVTRLCNLRCTYCHDWRAGPDAGMAFQVRAASLRWLLQGSGARRVDVILHGGEPSLLGVRGLTRLFALQARYRGAGQAVTTRMQTNGSRLTPQLINLLARFSVATGVSLDGPPEVHDVTRRDVKGQGSSDAVREAIGSLRQAGIFNGVLIVVTPTLLATGAERLVGFLAAEGVDNAALLPMRPAAGAPAEPGDSLATVDFCRFLLEVEVARRAIAPRLRIRELEAARAALAREKPQTCELQGHCIGSYFAIDPDGTITHCDKFDGDGAYALGKVEQPFDVVVQGRAATDLRAEALNAKQAKVDCVWNDRCRGWCPHEDYVARRLGAPQGCCGLAPLFEGLRHLEIREAAAMQGKPVGRLVSH